MVLGRESGHDVILSLHFCVRVCIVYLCLQYTLRRFLVLYIYDLLLESFPYGCRRLYMSLYMNCLLSAWGIHI